ncbi:hypothetical protein ES705_15409 [subsurface metagenome]
MGDFSRIVTLITRWDYLIQYQRYFTVTNMSAKPEGGVHFYNGRGTAEQWIKEGKYAMN